MDKKESPAPTNPPRTLGPVPNLEQHVRSDWWRGIFNALYLKTDGDVVDDPRITSKEIDTFLEILRPSPEAKILDLCCGQGRHTLELAARGFLQTEGLDRSHYLIQRARRTARKRDLPTRFREGDARKLPQSDQSMDYVMILGNSFGYFESVDDDLRVLEEVLRVLQPGGRILIDVANGEFIRQNFLARAWEWIDRDHFVCRERSLSDDGERLISREIITHAEKGVLADQFYAERLYSAEEITQLLNRAGFAHSMVHGTFQPESQRDQDLGMMEQRLIITAVAPPQAPRKRRSQPKIDLHVAVLFGDPSLPDALKPSTLFDEDDLETVQRLKQALPTNGRYRFTYLDRHATMLDDLKGGTFDYIFNLCDEGYWNDPRKELHVPVLLELLDLPYTGAGPQCLAYCYDKSLVRGIAQEMEITVPDAAFIKPEDSTFDLPFGFPVIVKPNFGDSSFGITQRSVAHTPEELLRAVSNIRSKFGYEKPILIEEFLTGKDLSVGIIGNPPDDYQILPIIEEDYSVLPPDLPPICGYEAKWLPDSPYWQLRSIPADLPVGTRDFIVRSCLKLFERLECRDYARFDWRLDSRGTPKLLEVNPNPGWVWDGHLAKMCAIEQMSYPEMLQAILRAAERRLGIPVRQAVHAN